MPTGYTATLMAKGQDFRSFVLTCARGMGACVMQRDDPMDQPPAKQKPSDYHSKAITEASAKLAKLKSMTPEQQRAYGEDLRAKAIASARQGHIEAQEQQARLDRMAAQVKAWSPPTDDHQGLKDFMLEQIQVSSSGDWAAKYVKEKEDKSPEAYFVDALSSAARDIKYHAAEHAKEMERTEGRNEWIEQLYKSLP